MIKPISIFSAGCFAGLVIFLSAGGVQAQIAAPNPESAAASPQTRTGKAQAPSPENVAAVVSERARMLAIAGRAYDPFGLLKDPSDAPPAEDVPQEFDIPEAPTRPTMNRRAVLEQLAANLRVTLIGPDFFIANGREWRVGETLEAQTRLGSLDARIHSISRGGVILADPETGFEAVVRAAPVPSGMTPARTAGPPQGMRSERAPHVIKLD